MLTADRASFRLLLLIVGGCLIAAAVKAQQPSGSDRLRKATFAGGCFWSMEPVFDNLPGVVSVRVGYTGGSARNPTYELVNLGVTGHVEAIEVSYDPQRIAFERLVDAYWHNTDPTDGGGQFCDRGAQYQPSIFYHDEEQRQVAEAAKLMIAQSARFKRIATQVRPASTFWPAEAYHQRFYKTHQFEYRTYRIGCGRDVRLAQLWGKAAIH